ncbi:putative zinc finger, C3HC4 type (RING finger) [Lyophyllum shimeji]|uniref:Zinc finger, C3HC4 type (RING finger) n=1 Tax=Lyophyllum shimeji TaxID=47721 RepID=A0A9P3UI00_LYOSH|nr:putative zinc finger, C3HC4 type (RING finger) [Lyophyllum shimeji]
MDVPEDILERIRLAIDSLPALTAQDLFDTDDSCPICLTPFSSLFLDTDPEAGVTKLVACNHIFCRKDLTQWIRSLHGNCPTCRHTFIDIRPPSESDEESSDGGEYIPDEDFDEEDDGVLDASDGFSDAFDFQEDMDTDAADEWGDEEAVVDADMEDAVEEIDDEAVWGLTDGESSNMTGGPEDDLASEDGHHNAEIRIGVNLADFEPTDGDHPDQPTSEEK